MPRHLRRGHWAEVSTLKFLEHRGLRLLEKNYRSRYGEIDLVMTERDILVFVEVRFRASGDYGGGIESVNKRKQRKLRNCAEHFLSRYPSYQDSDCRFDVVSVALDQWNQPQVEWITDAF